MASMFFKIVEFYIFHFIHDNQKGAGFPDPTSTLLIWRDEQNNVDISYIKFHTNRVINAESMDRNLVYIQYQYQVKYYFRCAGFHVTQNNPTNCLGHLMYPILSISD